jgi:outer membrane receptor protein involved in Fe transport
MRGASCRILGYLAPSIFVFATLAFGQNPPTTQQPAPPSGQAPPAPPPVFTTVVTVVGTTPLPGVDLPLGKVPTPVQVATANDIEASGALNLTDLLNRRFTAVHVNEMQNNPFQADLNYRGYTASPLLGTPQGVSVYMDGMRLNQPFGDVVSWDLIPRSAISSTTLMPGSNPIFGLNTLGGALSIQTKDGRSHPGTSVQATYGSHLRRAIELEHGGTHGTDLDWYLTGNVLREDGWRDDSPSKVGQFFGKLGWHRGTTGVNLSTAFADNSLVGNGLQDVQLLEDEYAGVYTKPDRTGNRATLLNMAARHNYSDRVRVSGNAYYRHIRTTTFNGDINEDSLDQAVYQPGAAELAALAAAGYTGVPASGATAANTPFPFWRCIGNVLLRDEPGEKCNGLINRTNTRQHNEGVSGQLTFTGSAGTRENQFTAGAAYDHGSVRFAQSSQLGYLNPDRSITGLNAFGDGVTGGDVDGEPYDTRVDLDGSVHTSSVYATDTLSVNGRWHVTLSGRYNRTTVNNRDQINPGGGPGSLDGEHVFSRFNPAAGLTVDLPRAVNFYAGYSEGSRAATSIELGCADPEEPCKLPNAMAGDPPLQQVVTRTFESGVRGGQRVSWTIGGFHADNNDDIIFVTSDQTGFGYFRNFGKTRRYGLEASIHTRVGRATVGAGYTFLSATYQSEETLNGESNSTNDEAEDGARGLEGTIEVEPGDRMPLIPRHMFKTFADIQVAPRLSLELDVMAVSSSFARGNENNQHEADGTYYLGDGTAPGYGVVDIGARYAVHEKLELVARVSNLFDRQYYSAAQLGPAGFTSSGTFIARAFPAVGGEFPVAQTTFYAPGAPRQFSIGTRIRF